MTNTEVMQFIISKLENSPNITWKNDKELFELIFKPILYGNDIEKRQQEAKQPIYDIFQRINEFNKKEFNKLTKKITCGEDEKRDREVVITFLQEEMTRIKITTGIDVEKLVAVIPCKNNKEKNYRSQFSNWKQNKPSMRKDKYGELIAVEGTAIYDITIKKALQKNFYFENDLWSKGDTFIKQKLQEGINQFILDKNPDDDIIDPPLTEKEQDDLLSIRGMNLQEIKQYLHDNHILSQKFVEKLIYILYDKGYYGLLLYEVFDKFYKDDVGIKKIKAHVLGSAKIGKYLEAYYLLSTISSDDDYEIVKMRTAATSNMRRHQLNNTKTDNNQKKEIIETLIFSYKKNFESNKNDYHYYPGINLAYMAVIAKILFGDDIKLNESISSIYNKSKKSINIDKNSANVTNKYYANITNIEFMLLINMGSPIAELEQFLEPKEQTIPPLELDRTKRQMQFFIDTVINSGVINNPIVSNIQESTKIIDDFIEYLEGFEIKSLK